MSLLSENVIPGNQGKVFGTNAKKLKDLERIKDKVLQLDGIEDVIINLETFPKQFIVHTHKLVSVEDIEEKVKSAGFHAIPKETLDIWFSARDFDVYDLKEWVLKSSILTDMSGFIWICHKKW